MTKYRELSNLMVDNNGQLIEWLAFGLWACDGLYESTLLGLDWAGTIIAERVIYKRTV